MPEAKTRIDICDLCPWLCVEPDGGTSAQAQKRRSYGVPPVNQRKGDETQRSRVQPVPGLPFEVNFIMSLSPADKQEFERLAKLVAEGKDHPWQHKVQAARLVLENNRPDIARTMVDQIIMEIVSATPRPDGANAVIRDAFRLRSEIHEDLADPVQAEIDSFVAEFMRLKRKQDDD